MKKNGVGLIFLLLIVGGTCYSEPPTVSRPFGSDVNKNSESWISNGGDLKGRWWLKNAKKYQPLPNPLLYHFEGHYSYSEQDGNLESEKHKGKMLLTLRKGLFTSVTLYKIKNRDVQISLVDKHVDAKDQFFRQGLRFAMTDQISAVIGKSWERSSAKFLQDRDTYYGGLQFAPIDTPKLNLMFAGYYGNTDISFMNREIQKRAKYKDFPSVADYDSDSLEFHHRLHWQITDKISLKNGIDYKVFLKDANSYLWGIDTKLEFKQTKMISFFLQYSIDYDDNKFIEAIDTYFDNRRALGMAVGDIEKTNTEFGIGIKFTF